MLCPCLSFSLIVSGVRCLLTEQINHSSRGVSIKRESTGRGKWEKKQEDSFQLSAADSRTGNSEARVEAGDSFYEYIQDVWRTSERFCPVKMKPYMLNLFYFAAYLSISSVIEKFRENTLNLLCTWLQSSYWKLFFSIVVIKLNHRARVNLFNHFNVAIMKQTAVLSFPPYQVDLFT